MTALEEAYQKHGTLMRDNMVDRAHIRNYLIDDPEKTSAELYLCRNYEPDAKVETGIYRFFKYHLWTHEPRIHVRRMYGEVWENKPTLPFLLFDVQREAVEKICYAIDNGHDVLIEKSRDMGISWLVISIFLYYWWLDKPGNDFLLGSRKLDYVDKKGSLDTLFEKFRYNLYRLPKIFRPEGFDISKHDNVGFILNPANGNYVKGESNNENFGTAGRYRAGLMDEFSKWEETDDSAWTSMGSDHPIKGAGKYEGAHPYDPSKGIVYLSEWYLTECERRKDDPQTNIGQELDIDYLSSGTPYFNNRAVQMKIDSFEKEEGKKYDFERTGDEITLREDSNGRITVLEEPKENWSYRYCISADVGEGLEKGDNSVMYVYDRVERKDVAWFVGKIDTTVFALLLSYFGYWYEEAYIAVESNNHGHAVIQKLKEIYDNLYREQDFSKEVDLEKVRLGWMTNAATRPIMCGEVRNAVNEGYDGVGDPQFYKECLTFIYNKNGKAEADANCLDDRVMAQGIKWMVHQWLPSPSKDVEKLEKKYDAPRFGGVLVERDNDPRIWYR
jgi:hypothetical protein